MVESEFNKMAEIQNTYDLNNSNLIAQKNKSSNSFGNVINMFGNKLNPNNASKYKPQPYAEPGENDYSDAYL